MNRTVFDYNANGGLPRQNYHLSNNSSRPPPQQEQEQRMSRQSSRDGKMTPSTKAVEAEEVLKTRASPAVRFKLMRAVCIVLGVLFVMGCALTALAVIFVTSHYNKKETDMKLFCNDSSFVFECADDNDQCLVQTQVCDGYEHCRDGSDEKKCPCKKDQYQCEGGRCLDDVFLCDGVNDCPAADDETRPSCVVCTASQFKCERDNTCVDLTRRCDGKVDCRGGSDEERCLTLNETSGLVAAVREGKEGLMVCAKDFNQTLADEVCKVTGFKDFLTSSSQDSTNVTASGYISIDGVSNAGVRATVASSNVSSCYRLLTLNCSEYECGKRSEGLSFVQYITNGYRAAEGAWPWFADLKVKGSSCGAVLISNQFALTAAHCLFEEGRLVNTSSIQLVVGHAVKTDPGRQVYGVSKVQAHPLYNDSDSETKNDLALIKIATEVVFGARVSPICLPSQQQQLQQHYKVCVSVGFGKASKDIYPDELLQTRLNLFTDQKCKELGLNDDDVGKLLCTGSIPGVNRNNICFGDSGGPLSCMDENQRWHLVGVHSFVLQVDSQNLPKNDHRMCQAGVVVNVVKYKSWIVDQMAKL